MESSRASSTARAQRGSSAQRQQTTTPEIASRRSVAGSSSAPEAAVLPGQPRHGAVGEVAASRSARRARPISAPGRGRASARATRKTGTSASRVKVIAFGSVKGRSGPLGARSAGRARPSGQARAAPRTRRLARGSAGARAGRVALGEALPQVVQRPAQLRLVARSTGSARAPGRARGGSAPRSRPTRARARPTVSRIGQPSSSASANFSPGSVVAVVVEHLEPPSQQLLVEPLGERPLLGVRLADPHEVHRERRERARPGDPVLVGVLLDGGRHDARRADAVGAHPDRLLAAALVEVGRAERLRVARAELEDVRDLDRGLDRDRLAADACRRPARCARRRA